MDTTNQTGVGTTSVEDAVDQMLKKHSEAKAGKAEADTISDEDLDTQEEELDEDTIEDTSEDETDVEPEAEDSEEEPEAEQDDHDGIYTIEVGDNKLELNEQDINGLLELKSLDVPFTDLKNSVLRQRDYTQKTQEVAEAKRVASEQANQKLEQLAEAFEIAETVIMGDLKKYENVNWKQLKEEDPYAFEESFLDYQVANEKYQELQTAISGSMQDYQEQQKQSRQVRLQEEAELLKQAMPEARSPDKWAPIQAQMDDYLVTVGFEKGAVNTIDDHKYMQIVRDASEYRKLKAGLPQTKRKVSNVKVLKAGTPKSKAQISQTQRKAMMDQALTSGDTESAVDAVANLMKRKR